MKCRVHSSRSMDPFSPSGSRGQGALGAKVVVGWAPGSDRRLTLFLVLIFLLGGCGGARSSAGDETGLGDRVVRGQIDDNALEGPFNATSRVTMHPSLSMSRSRSERCTALWPIATREARAAGLDPLLLMAIVWVESGFVADARSSAGAVGLMQLMKRTGAVFGCEHREDPVCSLRAGSALMARLLRRFDGQTVYALCAYNAGSSRVKRAFARGQRPSNHRYAERVFEARARLASAGCRLTKRQ